MKKKNILTYICKITKERAKKIVEMRGIFNSKKDK